MENVDVGRWRDTVAADVNEELCILLNWWMLMWTSDVVLLLLLPLRRDELLDCYPVWMNDGGWIKRCCQLECRLLD